MSSPSPAWPAASASRSRTASAAPSGQGRFSLRRMGVKIHYTLDGPNQFSVIARLDPRSIPTIANPYVGLIDFKSCIDKVLESSPELRPRVKHDDYTIYVMDYSEQDTPFVGQGSLARILSAVGPGPNAQQQPENRIVGRVCKSLSLMSNGGSETLEVRLKFVPCPSRSPREYRQSADHFQSHHPMDQQGVDINDWNDINDFLQDPLNMQNLDDLSSNHGDVSRQAGLDSLQQHFTPVQTPIDQNDNGGYTLFDDEQLFSMIRDSSPASAVNSPAAFQQMPNDISRPASRMSMQSNASAQSPFASADLNITEDANGDEGPSRKRARLTQISGKPRGSAFSASKAPLRQTATTAASIRNFRAGPESLQQQDRQTDGSNRAPTPRPHRHRNLERRQSGLARSALRQESSLGSPTPFEPSATPLQDLSSDIGMQEPMSDYNRPQSPMDFPSSPPTLPFNIYEDNNCPSSPLPPASLMSDANFDNFDLTNESDFSAFPDSALDPEFFDAHSETAFSNLPLPMSDSGFFSDGQGLKTPVKDAVDTAQQGQEFSRPETQEKQPSEDHKRELMRKNRIKNFQWQNNSYGEQERLPRSASTPDMKARARAQNAKGVSAWSHNPSQVAASETADDAASGTDQRHSIKLPHTLARSESVPTLKNAMAPQRQLQPKPQGPKGFALPGSNYGSPAPSPSAIPSPSPLNQRSPEDLASPQPSQQTQGRALAPISGNARNRAKTAASKNAASPADSAAEGQTPPPSSGANKRKRSRQPSKTPAVQAISINPDHMRENMLPIGPAGGLSSDPIASDPVTGPEEEKLSHLKKERIKQAREKALKQGLFPRFCEGCGNVDTPTWRRIFSRRCKGTPQFGSEKQTHYFTITTDEKGKVVEYMTYKRKLSKEERESKLFKEHVLCNGCGIHFQNCGRLRIPIVDPTEEELEAQEKAKEQQVAMQGGDGDKENVPPETADSTPRAMDLPQLQKTASICSTETQASPPQQNMQEVIEIQDDEEAKQQLQCGVRQTIEADAQNLQHPSDNVRQQLEGDELDVNHQSSFSGHGTNKSAETVLEQHQSMAQQQMDYTAYDEELFGQVDGLDLLGEL